MSFFSRAKDGLSAIFDIGPHDVGAALVLKKKGTRPQIVWAHREIFVDEKTKTPRQLLEALLSALKKINNILQKTALSELHLKGFRMPSSIEYVLSSPWVELEQKNIVLTFKEQTTITEKIVSDAVEKELAAFEASFKEVSGFAVVERTITGFTLNGYGIKDPYNKKALSIGISFTIAITPKEVLDRIEESVSSKKARTSSFITAAYKAVKEISEEKDFLCAVIEDNLTELMVVRENIPAINASFPDGSDLFAQTIADDLGIPFTEGLSLARMFFKKEADQATSDKLTPLIKKSRETWRKNLKSSIESIAHNTVLPRKAFFISSDMGSELAFHMTKNQKISEFGIEEASLETVAITPASLKQKIVFAHPDYADVRVALIAIASDQAEN